jgi:hypothetical protein
MTGDDEFIETTFVMRVLSREPLPRDVDIVEVLKRADDGVYLATVRGRREERIKAAKLDALLRWYGNDGAFFDLPAKTGGG